MLEKQVWLKLAPEMDIEWQQCMDEGLEVESYEAVCRFISEKADEKWTAELEEMALAVEKLMHNEKINPNFSYVQPSALEEIRNVLPKKRHMLKNSLSKDELRDKIKGAWIGRISGCLLGKPIEGYRREFLYPLLKESNNYPLNRYLKYEEFPDNMKALNDKIRKGATWADKIKGIAPIDDDTNYTVFGLSLLERYGRDFRPADVLEGWMAKIPCFDTCTAERVAYRNGAQGLLPPYTAIVKNPYREWIGAQIRGDFFGYINPGNTELAAEYAWRDASISHVKNGIYGEMFASAMMAAAAVTDDIMTVIEAGLDEIPENCRLREDVEKVINWHSKDKLPAQDIMEKIHAVYDENTDHGWCHTNSNAMIVVMALLCGEKDFGKSICLAVEAAFDTDCNGATVGSVIGMLTGGKNIPEKWTKAHNNKLYTAIAGYQLTDVDSLTEKTLAFI